MAIGLWDHRSVRLRIEQKIRKQLRSMRHKQLAFVSTVHEYERSGIPLVAALRKVMLSSGLDWNIRGTAAQVLVLADARGTAASLLDLFFTQTDKTELWETALAIEVAANRAAVPRLVNALCDTNPHRRHAAARALGWIPYAGKRAAKALICALLDKSQPQPVREEAAESLAYSGYAPAIPPVISVLTEPDVSIRFWAVFALGGIAQSLQWRRGGNADPRVIEALEGMLPDPEVPPGNWWPVGREALAMLGDLEPRYQATLDGETQRLMADPNSSPEDLRWADAYGQKNSEP